MALSIRARIKAETKIFHLFWGFKSSSNLNRLQLSRFWVEIHSDPTNYNVKYFGLSDIVKLRKNMRWDLLYIRPWWMTMQCVVGIGWWRLITTISDKVRNEWPFLCFYNYNLSRVPSGKVSLMLKIFQGQGYVKLKSCQS